MFTVDYILPLSGEYAAVCFICFNGQVFHAVLRFWLLRYSCPSPPPPVAAGEVFVLGTVDLVRWFQPVVVT